MASAGIPKDVTKLFGKLYKDKDVPVVRSPKKLKLGYPCLFEYDAKWKKVLKYYDTLPMPIIFSISGDRMLGINLHYIPYTRRIQLIHKLIQLGESGHPITYSQIKSACASAQLPMALAYLSIRCYIFGHIRSVIKQFDVNTYYNAVKEIRPKFTTERKGEKASEQAILNDIMSKFKNKGKKENTKTTMRKKK